MIKKYILLSCSAALCAVIYYLYENQITLKASYTSCSISTNFLNKKKVVLYAKKATWVQETVELVWSPDEAIALESVIAAWLKCIDEEQLTTKMVYLESVAITAEKELIISFSRNFLDKQSSTQAKLWLIESLLKTIRELKTDIKAVYFLVHHKPLPDYHLDFTYPWPITGFLRD